MSTLFHEHVQRAKLSQEALRISSRWFPQLFDSNLTPEPWEGRLGPPTSILTYNIINST